MRTLLLTAILATSLYAAPAPFIQQKPKPIWEQISEISMTLRDKHGCFLSLEDLHNADHIKMYASLKNGYNIFDIRDETVVYFKGMRISPRMLIERWNVQRMEDNWKGKVKTLDGQLLEMHITSN